MKIVVTGAAGMLGTAMIDTLRHNSELIATDISSGYSPDGVRWYYVDLLDKAAVTSWLETERPDVVVHCAALVNVDGCEKNPELAEAVHVGTTKTIADALVKWNGKLINISTDSVFDGFKNGPYIESDLVSPPNVYARTKLDGETPVLQTPRGLVLRTNIFGWSRAEKTSFAEWVIKGLVSGDRLTMFTDVSYTPIHVSHLAEVVRRAIDVDLCGLYHATGSTVLSKHAFGMLVAKTFGLSSSNIVETSVDSIGLGAKRPKNMALDNRELCKQLAWQIPHVEDGVTLLKNQYDSGWVAAIKERPVASGYRFWEISQ